MSNLTFSMLLNDYGVSNYYYYVHPVLSFIAMVLCIMCTVVLSSKELRTSGAFFQYSLVNSAGCAVGSFLLIFLFLTRCGGSPCSISTSYWPQIYTNYIVTYLYSNIYIDSGLIQIATGLQLYFTIKQNHKSFVNFSPYKFSFLLLCLSATISSAIIFANVIDTFNLISVDLKGNNVTLTYYYSHSQTNSPALLLLVIVVIGASTYVFFTFLIGVNILIYRELRKLMTNKMRMFGRSSLRGSLKTSETSTKVIYVQPRSSSIRSTKPPPRLKKPKSLNARSSIDNKIVEEKRMLRRSLIMTLWISTIFSFNRFIKVVYRTMVFVNQYSPYTYYLNAISYFIDLIMYMSFFFVYMKTNKVFRKKFYEIFFRRRRN